MVFKKYKAKSKKWNGRVFFHTNYKTGKRKFEALFFECLVTLFGFGERSKFIMTGRTMLNCG